MGLRTGTLAVVTGVISLILLTGPGSRQSPGQLAAQESSARRMFSPWYGEALRDILELEEHDVSRLEQRLAANPEDFPARLKLMAYHQRGDRSGRPEDRRRRVEHALWLMEHHPDSELLRSPVSHFSQKELTPEEFRRAVALWEAAVEARPGDPAVVWNAAAFFQDLDPGLHLRYLEATARADPNHPFVLRPLAHLYALSVLRGGPLAAHAESGLAASNNVWVLGNAAYVLQSLYNQSLQMGAPDARAARLAEHYFLRAKALDPNLDRQAILPQIDLEEIQRAHRARIEEQWMREARAESALGSIRRLGIEAFPMLPGVVAGVLRARNCRVPQPLPEGNPRNVIRGEFFSRGQAGWAVLCSVNHSTSLLVFRHDADTAPDVVATSEDRSYLEELDGGRIGYSREITAVDRDFILYHYRAYGGAQPPRISHHGIDDAFLEKASLTWYFHEGQWLQLQGAD